MASSPSSSPPPPPIALPPSESDSDSDDDGIMGKAVTLADLLPYHRVKMNNPNLTEDDLLEYLEADKRFYLQRIRDIRDGPPDPDSYKKEKANWNWISFEDRQCFLRCHRSGDRDAIVYGNRCVVTGLSKTAKIEELNKLFSEYGEIVESNILKDVDTGEPLGFGYICFKYQQWMLDAVGALNGKKVGDDTITVYASNLRIFPGIKDIVDDDGYAARPPPDTKHDDKQDAVVEKDTRDDHGFAARPPATKHDDKQDAVVEKDIGDTKHDDKQDAVVEKDIGDDHGFPAHPPATKLDEKCE